MVFFFQQPGSAGSLPLPGLGPVSDSDEERQRRAYRAALLSVYLNTETRSPMGPLPPTLPSFLPPPMSVETAYATIRERLTGESQRMARNLAASRLVKVLMTSPEKPGIAGRPLDAEAGLYSLLGTEGVRTLNRNLATMLNLFHASLDASKQTVGSRGRRGPGSELDSVRALSGGVSVPDWLIDRATWGLTEPPPVETLFEPCEGFSVMPLRTLVTDVQVGSLVHLSYQRLAEQTDPRSWGRSPFWRAAYAVARDGGGFTRTRPPGALGESWRGTFYEYVDWNWDERSLASFQCYLDIAFEADPVARSISLHFRLHSCQGSLLYSRLSQTGIDADHGRQTVRLLDEVDAQAAPETPVWFSLCTSKALRYTDILDRLTPHQGPPGAGAFLSYMAPIVAGLWVNDLVHGNLYAVEIGGRR